MDKSGAEPLTVETGLKCCSLLTYALDAPVVPVPQHGRFDARNARAFSSTLRGTPYRSIAEYGEQLNELSELVSPYLATGLTPPQVVQRVVAREPPREGRWFYYGWPPTEQIFRAMSAYWLGTLSVTAPSRILNFWRAFEAVVPRAERNTLFALLHARKVAPVWTRATKIPVTKHRARTINASRYLRRAALLQRDVLVARHGSSEAALKDIYEQGRGKAAHADTISLEYDLSSALGEQLRNAELVRYTARVAIEACWRLNVPNSGLQQTKARHGC